MSNLIRHPYHLVDESPWPILSASSALLLTTGLVKLFTLQSVSLLLWGTLALTLVAGQWWRDVAAEATHQGLHTKVVELGLRWGMALFIVSEGFFFLSFFWAFFHSSLSPSVEIGGVWPPVGVVTFNPFGVPLLNTLILVASGATVTWAHHSVRAGNFTNSVAALTITVGLGVYFSLLQAFEYWEAPFTMADSIYGSCFYLATGFHGFHVLVGTLFLSVCLTRTKSGHFSANHHFGFEAAAWYWHFVDVVWLFLFMVIYWWGG